MEPKGKYGFRVVSKLLS